MKKIKFEFICAVAIAGLALAGLAAQPIAPNPTGSQTDGHFRKVILVSDEQTNGKYADTLKDPMEIAVAADGRVFFAQRNGTIRVWKPDTKTAVEIAKVPVFDGLEDGMLGIALDPNFMESGWIYLNHSGR